MRIDWTYDGCDEHDVPAIEQHWAQVQLELEGKLAALPDTPGELRIAVECGESEPAWQIQAALHLPGRTLIATGSARRPQRAIDQMLHGLAKQIDALDETPVRVAQRREGLAAIVSFLQQWRAQNRSQAFLSFLIPLVNSVGPYVQRELNIRENEGTLIGEGIDASDVLDGVLVEAWEQFDRRKKEQPFDLWLVRLADEVIDRLSVQVADSSIDEISPIWPGDSLPYDGEAWIEQVSYPETIEIGELLPDEPGAETWDDADDQTRQSHLSDVLSKLDRDRRQAFVLNVAHGFAPREIADFQNRPLAEIDEDIAQATLAVKRWFIDEQTPDQEEPFAKAEMRQRRGRR